MATRLHRIWILLPLLALTWAQSATAVSVGGIAVAGGGAGNTTMVGIDPATLSPPNTGKIKYFIPLDVSTSGVYGDFPSGCTNGVGTCSDSGSGYGYDNDTVTALDMNIFFNLGPQPESVAASIDIVFDDLDLIPNNDPYLFFESVAFSYYDVGSGQFVREGPVIKDEAQLAQDPPFAGSTFTVLNNNPNDDFDPILWNLDLAGLGILSQVNDSIAATGGFWIQLGFDSKYKKYATNTPEYISATLNVSPVPLPSAVWLFGSALLGFIGMSRRTRV